MLKKLLFIVALLLIPAGITFSPLFKISKITIDQSNNCLSEEEVKNNLNNHNLIFTNSEKLKSVISKKSCVKSINVKKSYPKELKISLEITKGVAKLEGNANQLNEYGDVEELTNSNLPAFYDTKLVALKVGQKIVDVQILKSLKIASTLASSDFQAVSLRFVDSDFVAYDPQGTVAVFSLEKDANFQVDSLQQVLAKTKIDATKIAKIDLRFDKPIVLYK